MDCYLDTASKLRSHFKSLVSWMTVMWHMLLVSKEVFNLLSTAKMAAVVMDKAH